MINKEKKKIIFFFILTALAVVAVLKANRFSHDFHTFYRTAERLLAGNFNIYTLDDKTVPFWYPPFFAYLFSWFAFFSQKTAQILWGIINIFFVYGIWCQIKATMLKKEDLSYGFILLLILSVAHPLFSNFQAGNVHVFLLFLFFLCFRYWSENKILPAAFFLSIAILVKITPLVFLLYFIFKKEWKTVLYTLVFTTIFILLPGLFVGISLNLSLYQKLLGFVTHIDQAVNLAREEVQSIMGMSLRYLSHVAEGLNQVNILNLSREVASTVGKILCIIAVLPTVILFIKNYKKTFPNKTHYEWSIICVSLAFLTPASWIHTLLFLFPGYLLLLKYIFSSKHNTCILLAVILSWALIFLTPDFIWGRRINNFIECLSLPTFGSLILFYTLNYVYAKRSWTLLQRQRIV